MHPDLNPEPTENSTNSTDLAVPDGKVLFYTISKNLRLVRRSSRVRVIDGITTVIDEGEAIEFAPRGSFATNDTDTIEWLRNHRLYGRRFHEHGNEPDAPKVSVDERLSAITSAAIACDLDALSKIEGLEGNSYSREIVMKAIRDARGQVKAALKLAEPKFPAGDIDTAPAEPVEPAESVGSTEPEPVVEPVVESVEPSEPVDLVPEPETEPVGPEKSRSFTGRRTKGKKG